MTLLHQAGQIIAQRYRIVNSLGQGGMGITYKAEDLQSNQFVALKVLSLHRLKDWKALELFEREAKILSQLHHPAIPRYIDYFQIDTQSDRYFYIVQQLATGNSLAELVENGWQPEVNEVKRMANQILEVLVYLQELTPSVIHRDIKPQNIIRSDDGKIFLVDFGAVRDTYHNTVTGGSTVVGTFGYMAPEQFRGQAVLSTDLYGLGTTLLFLLARKSPADLPVHQMQIKFRRYVRVDRAFADWLEKMVAPVIEDRFADAKEALAVLQSERVLTRRNLVVDMLLVWFRHPLWFRFLALLGSMPVLGKILDVLLLKLADYSVNYQYFYQFFWGLSIFGAILFALTYAIICFELLQGKSRQQLMSFLLPISLFAAFWGVLLMLIYGFYVFEVIPQILGFIYLLYLGVSTSQILWLFLRAVARSTIKNW